MKNYFLIILSVVVISCNKDNDNGTTMLSENYSSMQDFYARNEVKTESHFFDANTTGTFRTANGTDIVIPANAFTKLNGDAVVGTVKIDFKEIYKKSEMVLSDKHTLSIYGNLLKSAGMFYIKATINDTVLKINNSKYISVSPLAPSGETIDTAMTPFVLLDTAARMMAWINNPNNIVLTTATGYIYKLYELSTPEDSGTWGNCDNPTYFYGYPQTQLVIHPINNPDSFLTDVFLVFNNVRTSIHIYRSNGDFIYSYAPIGLECTLVSIGVKDGDLYSSFKLFTVGSNQTVDFSLSKTTTAELKSKLIELD